MGITHKVGTLIIWEVQLQQARTLWKVVINISGSRCLFFSSASHLLLKKEETKTTFQIVSRLKSLLQTWYAYLQWCICAILMYLYNFNYFPLIDASIICTYEKLYYGLSKSFEYLNLLDISMIFYVIGWKNVFPFDRLILFSLP